MKICKRCGKVFKSILKEGNIYRNLSNRQHCLKCVPFRSNIRYSHSKIQKCVICNKETIRGRRLCNSCNTKVRRFLVKLFAVNLLGNKCRECGLDVSIENLACFDFHHKDDNKDFNISKYSNRGWNVVKEEVLKCELLCSNCHRIKHNKRNKDSNFIEEVLRYNGKIELPEWLLDMPL